MYYAMITAASLLFALQFLFNSRYEKEYGSSWQATLNFSLYTGVGGLILMLVLNKFQIAFSLFSVIVAIAYAIVNILYIYASVKAFEKANLSVYSMFAMLGGMLLPSLFGIAFSNEEPSLPKLICGGLIIAALLITVEKGERKNGAFKYYLAVFVLNGMVGVLSKFHQMNTELCVDSSSFMLWTKVATIVICIGLLAVGKIKPIKPGKLISLYCGGYAVFSTVGNLLLLIALNNLPASIQYPLVTGAVIVFSTVIGAVRGEKTTRRGIIAAAVAFIAAVVMMF